MPTLWETIIGKKGSKVNKQYQIAHIYPNSPNAHQKVELALSKEQLAKLNKKDILQLLLESMEQEKELRSQRAVLTDELKRTNQQMQVILEKWNLAQATRFGRSSEKMTYDTGACQQLELAIMYAECFNEAEACFLRQILLITPSFAYNRIQYE